jgi:acid stress-induced BolA-like protein IbaG/YrbA
MAIEVSGPPAAEAIIHALRESILQELPGAEVEVEGGGGHFMIRVISQAFEGKGAVDRQRLVYKAITPLMAGEGAPVHAIDKMTCQTP